MATDILALDIGLKRIGIARANIIAKIAQPLVTLPNDETFMGKLEALTNEYHADILVIGLPRNLNGQETAQSEYCKQFVKDNLKSYNVVWQDETLSTVKASERKVIISGIDAEAACIILEDYLLDNHEI